ncbi:MAG: TIGR00282 family metallophosphoesterase [Dehalococcoidia bacterium]
MRILSIGDVIGKPGRDAVASIVPDLRVKYSIDMVVANGENAAGGLGLTPATAESMMRSGIDVITSGNHIWKHKEMVSALDQGMPILRPLNYPPNVPGRGYLVRDGVMVVNLEGRVFMGELDCPFRAMESLLEETDPEIRVVLVDFHAEATSEKGALGMYLDGRVSAVVGTHTHIGTVDARILPRGTAFVTDIGMVGPKDSVIGDDPGNVIGKFLTQMPWRLTVGKGPVTFNSILVETDESGKAVDIIRIDREYPER